MGVEITKNKIKKILSNIDHPAIDLSLLELGIIKSFDVEGEKVKIVMAFPFPNIPIKEMLVYSVKSPLEQIGAFVEIETTVMTEEELHHFLELEQKSWKGGYLR